jgi:hypothetical protein
MVSLGEHVPPSLRPISYASRHSKAVTAESYSCSASRSSTKLTNSCSHRHSRHSAEWPAQMPCLRGSYLRPCSHALGVLTPRPATCPSVAPPGLIMKHRPCCRSLVHCPALLQQLRRIGQVPVRASFQDYVPWHVQDQEILDPVFLPDFRTWKEAGGDGRISDRGTCRRSRFGSHANGSGCAQTDRCSAHGCG